MCASTSLSFMEPEAFEGEAPRDSGLLAVKGVFYRHHEIACPNCDHISLRQPLSDMRAEFGIKVKCGYCGYERVYRRLPVQDGGKPL